MPTSTRNAELAERYRAAIEAYIEAESSRLGSSEAVNPGHRVPFHWPPHPISYDYHVLASDWRGSRTVELFGEPFEVLLAQTPNGVFGRCTALWAEARGKTEEEMVEALRATVEPLFRRQTTISGCLGRTGRFTGHLKDLETDQLIRLFYCPDRDVASDARTALETRHNKTDMLPALLTVLRDERHPLRRSAQWCVLDLFEDLPSYCQSEADELEAIAAMQNLIRHAPDDHARTIYKAGVVLGGHLPDLHGGPALIACLDAPSRIGRRSAIHGLFHVVEWHPELRDEVVAALRRSAESDPEPRLRDFAAAIADDIEHGSVDHVAEPDFDGE